MNAHRVAFLFAGIIGCVTASFAADGLRFSGLREMNSGPATDDSRVQAIVGAMLIDGRGGPVVPNATVLIRGNRIVAAGAGKAVSVPNGARFTRRAA